MFLKCNVRLLIENVGTTNVVGRATKTEHVVAQRATRLKMDLSGPGYDKVSQIFTQVVANILLKKIVSQPG